MKTDSRCRCFSICMLRVLLVGVVATPFVSACGTSDPADVPTTDAGDVRNIDAIEDSNVGEDTTERNVDTFTDPLPNIDTTEEVADTDTNNDTSINRDAEVDVTEDTNVADADADVMNDGTRVFVTSLKYDGNLGGLVGGDAKCQALADEAALGGMWLAWLGDGVDGPVTRFVQSNAAYHLVGGERVAENWPDLIDGTIAVPINRDETGTELPSDDDMVVWTAVFHTGGNPTPVNCTGWTAAEMTFVPTGLASSTDTGWTVSGPRNCSEMHRIYCFEQ